MYLEKVVMGLGRNVPAISAGCTLCASERVSYSTNKQNSICIYTCLHLYTKDLSLCLHLEKICLDSRSHKQALHTCRKFMYALTSTQIYSIKNCTHTGTSGTLKYSQSPSHLQLQGAELSSTQVALIGTN